MKRTEEHKEDQGRDGGTNFILRMKEQEIRLIFHERDDDGDDDARDFLLYSAHIPDEGFF
jgi:hypothetical protein